MDLCEDKYSFELNIDNNIRSTTILADRNLLIRMFQNIINNCISHNPDGCNIVGYTNLEHSNFVAVIADNGKGMDEERLKTLINNPYDLNSADGNSNYQHGLGLMLVRQIVDFHHGTITFHSSTGNGFRVEITLPASPVEDSS